MGSDTTEAPPGTVAQLVLRKARWHSSAYMWRMAAMQHTDTEAHFQRSDGAPEGEQHVKLLRVRTSVAPYMVRRYHAGHHHEERGRHLVAMHEGGPPY